MDIRTFIGDRSFYKKIFTIAVPIMIQNGITNFVALLDNIMVGQLGTAQMSGTAVINQLLFVFNLCIFGILAGPGIYGAQFFGKGSSEGVRNTFRFKLYAGLLVLLAGGRSDPITVQHRTYKLVSYGKRRGKQQGADIAVGT